MEQVLELKHIHYSYHTLDGDNFLKNQHLYAAALRYYYENDFTYIELGDGDELWENRSFTAIKEAHATTFQMLARFYADQRLYLLYGNHDMSKRSAAFSSQCDTFHPIATGNITFSLRALQFLPEHRQPYIQVPSPNDLPVRLLQSLHHQQS